MAEPQTSLDRLAHEIMRAHTAALGLARTSLSHAKHTGDLLRQAKAEVKAQMGHGHWQEWLAAHCDLSEQVAQYYMRIAKHWSRLEEIQKAYPNTVLDITEARLRLAKDDDSDDDDDTDADDDELGGGGCGGAGRRNPTAPRWTHFNLTIAARAQLRRDVATLATHFGITETHEATRLVAVVARACAVIVNQSREEHDEPAPAYDCRPNA